MTDDDSPDRMIVCARCGTRNFSFAVFCIVCGRPLEDAPEGANLSDGLSDYADGEEAVGAHGQSTRNLTPTRTSAASSCVSVHTMARWETWTGLVLVAVVIGYALFDWSRVTTRAEAYYEGLAAAASKDWDRAASAFGRAESHRDAGARRREALDKIAERDHLYSQAVQALGEERWPDALAWLNRLQGIQPDFRDSAALAARARTIALRQGLAGIAYLVVRGASPGLYVRDLSGRSHHLPGSDRQSRLRAISTLGGTKLVYDRSDHHEELCIPHTAGAGSSDADGSGRVLALVELGPDWTIRDSQVLRGLHHDGAGVFAQQGLWWHTRISGSGSFEQEVFYYDWRTGRSVRVSDTAGGRRVVAFDPRRSRVVIAEAVGEPRDAARETVLYLADAWGRPLKQLHRLQGDVYRASVSHDGRWLLYASQYNGDSADITRTIWVVNLDDVQAHATVIDRLVWRGIQVNRRLTASFLPATGAQVRLAVSRIEDTVESLSIYTLNDPLTYPPDRRPTDTYHLTAAYTEPSRPGSANRRDVSGFSYDGLYVGSRRQEGGAAKLEIFGGAGGITSTLWTRTRLPAYPDQLARVQFAPRNDYLIASVYNPDGINRGSAQRVYSARIGQEGELSAPQLIATAALPYETVPVIALPPDGRVLVYVDTGLELRAVSLDGTTIRASVATDVRAVWSLTGRADLSWLR